MRGFASAALAFVLASCASGTMIVTGERRPEIAPEAVRLYSEPPAHYEVIGLVSATGRGGFTSQQALSFATNELREQAAKLGANGVLIETTEQGRGAVVGTVVGGTILMSGGDSPLIQKVTGRAIYVPE